MDIAQAQTTTIEDGYYETVTETEVEEGYLGTFVEYADKTGNLTVEPYSLELINKLEHPDVEDKVSIQCIACIGEGKNFTYRTYDIYNEGITKSWSYLSNPYFIISIARGATYKKTTEFSTTVSASYSGSLPLKSKVNSTFGLTSSGTKSFKKEITLSGPASPYNSRDFYYKKGRHTHKVRTVEKLRNKNGTIISSKTHIGYLGVPAIKNYSVDTK